MDDTSVPTPQPNGQQPLTEAPWSSQGGMSKEHEILLSSEEPIEAVKEFQIPKEVSPHLQPVSETVELPPDLKQAGVTIPPQDMPVVAPAQTGPSLPLTDDQIGQGLQADLTTSFRWLAEWCLKQIRLFHMHLSKVGEHFMRVRDT